MRLEIGSKLVNKSKYFNLIIFLVILMNLTVAHWNVDPYHEGAIYPSAFGFSDGLHIFSQVNQQYGFIQPMIIGLILHIFGLKLIIGRYVGEIVILISAFLFYKILVLYISKNQSKFFVLLWLGVSPVWSWPYSSYALSGGSWPNHFGLLFVLLTLFFLLKTNAGNKFFYLISGIFVVLSTQSRLEFYFVWIFMTIAVFFFKRNLFLVWIFGNFLACLFIFIYLSWTHSLRDWYLQTIRVWTMNPPDVPKINFYFFIFNGFNFFILLFLFILTLAINYHFLRLKLHPIFSFLFSAIIFELSLNISHFLKFQIKIGNINLTQIINDSMSRSLFSYVNFILFISFLAILALLVNLKKLRNTKNENQFPLFLVGSTCFGLLSLFHNFNADYSQIIIPVFIIFLVIFKQMFFVNVFNQFFRSFSIVSFSLIAVSFSCFFIQSQKSFIDYKADFLSGMKGQNYAQVTNLDHNLHIIDSSVVKGKLLMVCQTGLLTVNDRGYLGLDKWSWNQQPSEMLQGRFDSLRKGDSILACHLNNYEFDKLSNLSKEGTIIEDSENNDFILYKVVK